MAWVATAIAGASFVTSLYGASQQRKAGKQSKELGRENAAFIAMESAEEARRLLLSQEQVRGTAKHRIAASGFRSGKDSMGASHKAYLTNLKSVQEGELDWLKKSSLSRQKIAELGGQMQQTQMNAAAFGSYAQAGNAAFSAYNTIQNRPG